MTRTPLRTEGALALKLDFGGAVVPSRRRDASARSVRLVPERDKYKVLEHRRRQAQIAARRLLDVVEGG